MIRMEIPFTGGCACGAIRYECSAEPIMMFKCHFRDCHFRSRRGVARPTWRRAPHPFSRSRSWLMGKKESYECNRRFPDRAQPLGIDVRVARDCCDTLWPKSACTSRRLACGCSPNPLAMPSVAPDCAPPSDDGRLPSYFLFPEAGTDDAAGFFWPLTFFAFC